MDMIRPPRWAYALALALAVTGCGASAPEETGTGETMTEEEAAEKVREHIDDAMTALPDTAELEERRGTIVAACDDPTDGGPKDRVTVNERFWVRGLPVEDNEANVDALLEHWTANGYKVLHDQRPDRLFLAVENEEDAFRMSIRTAGDDSLTIGASSPCIRLEGTPEP